MIFFFFLSLTLSRGLTCPKILKIKLKYETVWSHWICVCPLYLKGTLGIGTLALMHRLIGVTKTWMNLAVKSYTDPAELEHMAGHLMHYRPNGSDLQNIVKYHKQQIFYILFSVFGKSSILKFFKMWTFIFKNVNVEMYIKISVVLFYNFTILFYCQQGNMILF